MEKEGERGERAATKDEVVVEEMVAVMRRKKNKRERRWEEKSIAALYQCDFYYNRGGKFYFPSRLYNCGGSFSTFYRG